MVHFTDDFESWQEIPFFYLSICRNIIEKYFKTQGHSGGSLLLSITKALG